MAFATFLLTSFSLLADDGREKLSLILNKFNSFETLRSNITLNGTIGGTLSYQKPYLFHLKFQDGRVISANGKTIWFYSPERGIAGKQELKGGTTGGLSGLLSGYEEVVSTGKSTIKLTSANRNWDEVTVAFTENYLPKTIRLRRKTTGETSEINFTSFQTNLGLSSDLFNFHPPSNAQIVENPLNQRQ